MLIARLVRSNVAMRRVLQSSVACKRPIKSKIVSVACSRLAGAREPFCCAAQHSKPYLVFVFGASRNTLKTISELPGSASREQGDQKFAFGCGTQCNSQRVAPATRNTRRVLLRKEAARRHSPFDWSPQIAITCAGRRWTRGVLSNGVCEAPCERHNSCRELESQMAQNTFPPGHCAKLVQPIPVSLRATLCTTCRLANALRRSNSTRNVAGVPCE